MEITAQVRNYSKTEPTARNLGEVASAWSKNGVIRSNKLS
jgi:hypothetical protein